MFPKTDTQNRLNPPDRQSRTLLKGMLKVFFFFPKEKFTGKVPNKISLVGVNPQRNSSNYNMFNFGCVSEGGAYRKIIVSERADCRMRNTGES